ncbi:MAG: NAD-dependent epimerase/dehydratase family protein [Planctomycetes bacterium]|nr:NAD-dependent epimerase/dehydratase family protein [Planctomycetota bacterium]
MTILLTGGTGELGLSLLSGLAQVEAVWAISRQPRLALEPGTKWLVADLLDPPALESACRGVRVVIHMAAATHSAQSAPYFDCNVQGTANLLSAAERAGVELFVHISTRAIGAAGGAYSHSKELAEQAVKKSQLAWVILRPAEVYGTGGRDPVLSLAQSLRKHSFVPILGAGQHELSPVCIEDVRDAILRCVQRPVAQGHTYVLAGPQRLTYLELVERLEGLLGLSPRRRIFIPLPIARMVFALSGSLGIGPYVPDQLPRLLLPKSSDIREAARDLDYEPRVIEAGLRPLLGLPSL